GVLGWLQELQDGTARGMQLAAEAGGGVGFLLRPVACRPEPSWAETRLLVGCVAGPEGSGSQQSAVAVRSLLPLPTATADYSRGRQRTLQIRRFRVEVLHCRGGVSGTALELEWNDETGDLQKSDVHLASRLAHSTSASRAAGA